MFCGNCGKPIPDSEIKLCAECAAQKASQAEPVGAGGQVEYAMPSQSGKGFFRRFKLPVILCLVLIAALVITVVAFAVSVAESEEVKLITGIGELLDTGDEYTFLSLLGDLSGEMQAVGKKGTTDLQMQLDMPYAGEMSLDMTLKNDGKRVQYDLGAEAGAERLEPSSIYMDENVLAFSLLDSGEWYGLRFDDLDASLAQSGGMAEGELTGMVRQMVDLFDGRDKELEELAEAFGKVLYKALPDANVEKDKEDFNGASCTVYTLSLDGEDAADFLAALVRGMADNETISTYLLGALNMASSTSRLGAGAELTQADLDAAVDTLVEQLDSVTLFDTLELSVYYDGKEPVGLNLDIRDIPGEISRVKLSYVVDAGKDETERNMKLSLRNVYDREMKLTVKGTWSGEKNDSTDRLKISYDDGWDSFTFTTELKHRVEQGTATDTIEYSENGISLEFRHVLDGSPEDKAFSSELGFMLSADGETMDFSLGMTRDSAVKIDVPEAEILTDGSENVFDEDVLETAGRALQTQLPELLRFFAYLEDMFAYYM